MQLAANGEKQLRSKSEQLSYIGDIHVRVYLCQLCARVCMRVRARVLVRPSVRLSVYGRVCIERERER